MRTYATIAALAMTVAACGAPAARTTTAAHAAAGPPVTAGADLPERAPRRVPAVTPVAAEPARATPAAAPARSTTPRRTTYGRWRTPEAAMRYLARAYTKRDDVSLRHVTNPAARDALVAMRDYAPDLRLVSCEDSGSGSYTCTFSHAIKNSTERGSATLQAAPALEPGWYATALTDCGD